MFMEIKGAKLEYLSFMKAPYYNIKNISKAR
jgi:hypothetical protein